MNLFFRSYFFFTLLVEVLTNLHNSTVIFLAYFLHIYEFVGPSVYNLKTALKT